MNTETPRTDASKRVHSRYHDPRTPHFPRETYCVDYDDAVRLERDLTAARARVAELEAFAFKLATYPRTRGDERSMESIRKEARALISPSQEPKP